MDRKYKAADSVKVYQSSKTGPLIETISRVPYSIHGFDSYTYKGKMYKGYAYWDSSEYPSKQVIYILLDEHESK